MGRGERVTHNINTLVTGNTDLGALGTEIYTDDRHCLDEEEVERGRREWGEEKRREGKKEEVEE